MKNIWFIIFNGFQRSYLLFDFQLFRMEFLDFFVYILGCYTFGGLREVLNKRINTFFYILDIFT